MNSIGYNSTSYAAAGVTSLSSAFPFITIIIIIAILVGLAISVVLSKKLLKFMEKIGVTLGYTFRGLAVSIFGIVLYSMLNVVGDSVTSIPLEYYLYGLIIFAIVTLIGYVSTKIYEKIMSNMKKASKP